MIIGGILILKNNYQVANNFRISFAEQHMGSGGSFALWKVFGVLIILAGMTVVFGIYDNILSWALSPLTNLFNLAK